MAWEALINPVAVSCTSPGTAAARSFGSDLGAGPAWRERSGTTQLQRSFLNYSKIFCWKWNKKVLLQLRIWGWPGQCFCSSLWLQERNAIGTYSGCKDIIPLLALTVSHSSPHTIFTCPLFLSGAAPQHEGRLLRLPGMANPKYSFLSLCTCCGVSWPSKVLLFQDLPLPLHLLGGFGDHGILTGLFNSERSKYRKWIHVLFNYFFRKLLKMGENLIFCKCHHHQGGTWKQVTEEFKFPST